MCLSRARSAAQKEGSYTRSTECVMDFPNNIMVAMLLYLDLKSILKLACTCKSWNEAISNNPYFWKSKFNADFGTITTNLNESCYERQYKLEHRFRFAQPNILDFDGRHKRVTGVVMYGDLVVSGSFDGTVRVWDISTLSCVNFFCTNASVLCVGVDGDRIAAGLYNGRINVWDLKTGGLTQSYTAHGCEISDIQFGGGCLVSLGLWDATVKVWDLPNRTCKHSFSVPGIKKMNVNGNRIVATLRNGKVQTFSTTGELIHSLCDTCRIASVCSNSQYVFGGVKGGVKVWTQSTGDFAGQLECGSESVGLVQSDLRKVIGVSSNSQVINVWDINTFKLIRKIELGDRDVLYLSFDASKIVLGSRCGCITVITFDF